jgi:hypothetical protein
LSASDINRYVAFRPLWPLSAYATKRSYGWFVRDAVEALARYIRQERMWLIEIVRDPKDALTSRHARQGKESFYLEPERWTVSAAAGEFLFRLLDDYPDKLTIRYEDVVGRPEESQRVLMERIGFELRDGVESWGNLADNIELLGLSTKRAAAMHEIRNFDSSSTGRWSETEEGRDYVRSVYTNPEHRETLERFSKKHGYDLPD